MLETLEYSPLLSESWLKGNEFHCPGYPFRFGETIDPFFIGRFHQVFFFVGFIDRFGNALDVFRLYTFNRNNFLSAPDVAFFAICKSCVPTSLRKSIRTPKDPF